MRLKKMIFILCLLPLFILADYKYIGSFKAGETISGYGSRNHTGILYDLIVESYTLVEFIPQKVGIDSVAYKIGDYAGESSSYFSSTVSATGSTTYPDGFKIHLMPGTYRVLIYALYDETQYLMNTTISSVTNQNPPTRNILYSNTMKNEATLITTNIEYADNIGFYRDTMGEYPNFMNGQDYFSFTLTKKSDINIDAKIQNDFLKNSNYQSISFSISQKNNTGDYINACASFITKDTDISNTCTLEAGSYLVSVYPYNYTSGSYNFTIKSKAYISSTTDPITPTVISSDIWEQRDKFNPLYPPVFNSDGSVSLPFAPFTNAKEDADGYYDANSIITKDRYNLLGSTVQIKFALNGADNYFSSLIGISDLTTGLPYQYLSTDHQWGPTKLVNHNSIIYYQMVIDDNGAYQLTLSYSAYGDNAIHSDIGTLTSDQLSSATSSYIYFNNGDNYAGTSASAILYEFKITKDYSAESKATQTIGNINFLELEPDGYFSWSEANSWCSERGYRLPTMDELIASWEEGGSTISPTGFKKDTFYWASNSENSVSHQACAMDYDCSKAGAWGDDSNGHPKCVVSVNTNTNTQTTYNPHTIEEPSSGGGALGYILPLFVLGLLYFRREEQE
ncbi:MAG: hypothetical protein QM493_03330 [Sulfurovum sp.]